MDVRITIRPQKSTFLLETYIHCFTSWSWFPAILLSHQKSKDQKRGSTKYCFALVRNVGAGLTNHRLIIVLTCLSCATYVVSKVFQIIIRNSKQLKIISSQFSESGCSSGPSAPSASDQELGCSDLVHHDSGSEEGIIENLYHRYHRHHIGEESLKKTFFRTQPKLPLPPSPLIRYIGPLSETQNHWFEWPSLPSIPQPPTPKCPGWLDKMGLSLTVQLSSWSGSSATRSTPGSLPSWFPSTRTRNLAFTPQRWFSWIISLLA